ncbi:MAG: hypothetical protein ACXV8K_04325, partial [Ilumatobacteraceae bacterium]
MNRSELLLVGASLGLVVGIALVWSGWHYETAPARVQRAPRLSLVSALVVACLVGAISGWIVPSCVIGAIAGWLSGVIGRRRRGDDAGVERTEALASWIENVRDVLQSGNQPIGAIGATTATCPPLIRPQVLSLFARLSAGQPPDV